MPHSISSATVLRGTFGHVLRASPGLFFFAKVHFGLIKKVKKLAIIKQNHSDMAAENCFILISAVFLIFSHIIIRGVNVKIGDAAVLHYIKLWALLWNPGKEYREYMSICNCD